MTNSNNKCIRRATELNNKGVSLLASGSFGEAFKSCKAALTIMNGAPVSDISLNPSAPATKLSKEIKVDSVDVPDFSETKCKISIYNRAFIFRDADSASVNMAFICSVITYNMALALQMHGRFTNKSLSGKKALRLYELTTSLIEEACHCHALNVECIKLRIATLNNQAEINYEICRFKETDEILSLVLLEFTNNSAVASAFSEHEMQELLLNIVLPSSQSVAPAA